MTNVALALYTFFSGFGLPAFVEENVPTGTEPPYITYELVSPHWKAPAALRARVWYRSSSYVGICEKVDAIRDAIGDGISLKTDSGTVWLSPESNFAQFQPTDEVSLKVAYLSMIIHAHTD